VRLRSAVPIAVLLSALVAVPAADAAKAKKVKPLVASATFPDGKTRTWKVSLDVLGRIGSVDDGGVKIVARPSPDTVVLDWYVKPARSKGKRQGAVAARLIRCETTTMTISLVPAEPALGPAERVRTLLPEAFAEQVLVSAPDNATALLGGDRDDRMAIRMAGSPKKALITGLASVSDWRHDAHGLAGSLVTSKTRSSRKECRETPGAFLALFLTSGSDEAEFTRIL
jgi:hypothetical protein